MVPFIFLKPGHAETTRTVFNPFTGKLDYITSLNGLNWPITGSSGCLTLSGGVLSWGSCGGSTVLQSSGVAFGSPTNTVTSDTTTFRYDNTAKSLSLGPLDSSLSGTLVVTGNSGSIISVGAGNSFSAVQISTNTNKTMRGLDFFNTKDDLGISVLQDYGGALLKVVPPVGPDSNFTPLSLIAGNAAASPLLNSIVIQSSGVAISSDTYIAGSLNLTGINDSGGIFTIAGSTYGVTSASTAIPSGHVVLSGNATNFTLIDGGVLGTSTPGGNAFNVQYSSANGTQLAGSDNLTNNGSTVTFSGVYTIIRTNVSSETASGVNFDYTGSTITVSSGTLTNATFVNMVVSTATYNGVTNASLGASAPNGTLKYCSDCTVTTPATCVGVISAACVCAGSGSGAFAKRLNNTWYCN